MLTGLVLRLFIVRAEKNCRPSMHRATFAAVLFSLQISVVCLYAKGCCFSFVLKEAVKFHLLNFGEAAGLL